MIHKLIIFTQDFPYARSETFLESELPYLEKAFDNILIISTSLHKGYQQTRKIGSNTRTYPMLRPNGRAKQIWGIANGIRYFSKDEKIELGKYKSIKKKIAVLYYTGRYEAVKRKCRKEIETFVGEDRNQTVVFYSYWFVETAQVAVDLANDLRRKGINCAVCTRAHGFDVYEIRNPMGLFPYREKVLDGIDYVFPCSANGEDYLGQRYPKYNRKISRRYLGTLDHGVNPENTDDVFTIVTCSNLVPVKRLTVLAEALRFIDSTGKDIRLKWVCIGDGPERESLQLNTISLKKTNVIFTGSMKNNDVLLWYQNNHVDLMINTSSSEGLPVSIMETSSFGIPVLATDVGGTSEIVIEGKNGKLLPEDVTAEQLGNEIISFYEMGNDDRIAYREHARKIWEESFCADNNYRLFAKELVEMTDQRK